MESKTYYIWTVGCQMNVGDSRRLGELLEGQGYREAADIEAADLIVLNTCVVRQSAEDRVLGRLSSLKNLKARRPEITLAVMGCLVGVSPEETDLAERFPYVDFWLPPSSHEQLVSLVSERPGRAPAPAPSPVSRYVTIMQGCNNFCSYCIVPYRRGRERSRPVEDIVAEVSELAGLGAKEVTLLGQNVDSYGRDLPGKPTLAQLLRQVHPVEGIVRLRFLTNHPKDMTQELIATVAELPKVCEHIELPLQSGSNEVLRRMNRHYTREQYLELVGRIQAAIPGVALATDVIVGYPGETRAQFQETYDLL
ncbi:MAG: MiaB/RimO family radical SAM methylthiotransferase, partial [Anaerolineae bacterium]